MVDILAGCLTACSNLEFDRISVNWQLLDEFRSRIFQLLRRYEGDTESTFKRKLRRRLWQFVIDLSSIPLQWESTFEAQLGLEANSFVRTVCTHYGSDHASIAEEIMHYWTNKMSQRYTNPIYTEMVELLSELRNNQSDFQILASNRQRPHYEPLLAELELVTPNIFCSPATLKYVPPFDCLITCGPFRDDVDAILTAPRYTRLVNVRWLGDNDVLGFPNYMSSEGPIPDGDTEFPADFPVRVQVRDSVSSVLHSRETKLSERDEPELRWCFDDFESLFVRRARIRRSRRSSIQRPQSETPISTHEFASVQFHFVDGSYWSIPFDQQNKSPLVYSIDREVDDKPVKRRAPLAGELPTDRDLLPGMLVVVEPAATTKLLEIANEKHVILRSHLPEWKAKLRFAVECLGSISLQFKFQTLRFPIDNINSKIQRWMSTLEGHIDAPHDYETFSIVVGTFAGYPAVDAAWEEILQLRGAAIQDGLTRGGNIDDYLLGAVRSNFGTIVDESRTEINVEGFEEPAIVIELSDVKFFREGEIAQLGRYRFVEDMV